MGRERDDGEASRPDERDSASPGADISPETVREEMEPLKPYTTRDVADLLDIPRDIARKLLNALYVHDEIEKKEPASAERPLIWIRNPPLHTCPSCDHEFRIRFVHPVFSTVHYCPQCGARVEE